MIWLAIANGAALVLALAPGTTVFRLMMLGLVLAFSFAIWLAYAKGIVQGQREFLSYRDEDPQYFKLRVGGTWAALVFVLLVLVGLLIWGSPL
jgi:hypothetical protein